MEPFIRAQYKLNVGTKHQDGMDPATGARYEIKTNKALTPRPKLLKLLDRIFSEKNNTEFLRMVSYDDRYLAQYGANVQNVKRDHFDFLIYVILFSDMVLVFQIAVGNITKDRVKAWSGKHGLYDADGKSGQFNIDKRSIVHHEKENLKDLFTYEQLLERYETL